MSTSHYGQKPLTFIHPGQLHNDRYRVRLGHDRKTDVCLRCRECLGSEISIAVSLGDAKGLRVATCASKLSNQSSFSPWHTSCVIADCRERSRVTQQNLRIPEHAFYRTWPSWLFDARLSFRDRLASSPLMKFWFLPFLLKIQITNLSPLAPGVTPKTTQWRCAQLTSSMSESGKYTSLR